MKRVYYRAHLFQVTMVIAAVVFASYAVAEIASHQSPGPRFGHEMVYDEARGVTILFGGFGQDGIPKGDTWLWDGEAWQLATTDGPSPRKWAAAAYDSRRAVVVLHGGREGEGRSGLSLSDTWIWDGHNWTDARHTTKREIV
jgi:hypothetical protein